MTDEEYLELMGRVPVHARSCACPLAGPRACVCKPECPGECSCLFARGRGCPCPIVHSLVWPGEADIWQPLSTVIENERG
jgi:hypothetical protein